MTPPAADPIPLRRSRRQDPDSQEDLAVLPPRRWPWGSVIAAMALLGTGVGYAMQQAGANARRDEQIQALQAADVRAREDAAREREDRLRFETEVRASLVRIEDRLTTRRKEP